MEIRDAAPADLHRILELNNVDAEAVNALREDSLAAMCAQGFAVLAAGREPIEAFLGNAEEWGKYTTDDFLLTFTDGSVTTKQRRMSMIAGHPTPAIARVDEKWRIYGTTAILTGEQVIFGKRTRLTAVWVREQGVWKVAAVQFTIVAQP